MKVENEINKKSYIIILSVLIALVGLLIVCEYISFISVKKFEVDPETKIDTEPLIVHLDIYEPGGTLVELSGYAYMEDETIKTINSYFVLIKQDSNEKYILRTRRENNINVPKVYKKSGIHTRFLKKLLPSGRYDIYVLYQNNDNNCLNNTGIYLDV